MNKRDAKVAGTLIKYCTIWNFAVITLLYPTSYEQKWRSI